MSTARFQRFLPTTGVIAGVLLAVGLVVTRDAPEEDAAAAVALDYWRDNADTYQLLGFLVAPLLALTVLAFGVALRARIRSRETGEAIYSTLTFGGAVVTAGAIGLVGAVEAAAARTAESGSLDATFALHQMASYLWIPWVVGLAGMLIGAGLGGLRTLALPRALAWPTLVMGVLLVTPIGFLPFLLVPVWLIATGVTLMARPDATAPARSARGHAGSAGTPSPVG